MNGSKKLTTEIWIPVLVVVFCNTVVGFIWGGKFLAITIISSLVILIGGFPISRLARGGMPRKKNMNGDGQK